jgi:DNA polymerase-1
VSDAAVVFDIETNGLLDELTTIHCISLQEVNPETGEPLGPILSADNHGSELTLEQGLQMLEQAALVIGHNIIDFDIPAIAKLRPGFKVKRAFDTLLLSTLLWPNLRDLDFERVKKKSNTFPGQMIGRHSLESWGYRLGKWKGDYSAKCKEAGIDPWARWSQDMGDYCDQDVAVTQALFKLQMGREPAPGAVELEHSIAPILGRQVRYGFLFNQKKADMLERELLETRQRLADELAVAFPPRVIREERIPKRSNKTKGWIKGEPYIKETRVVFKPTSRDHIADRLIRKYGWKPKEFTDNGKPKVDEDILSPLKYPEIPLLLKFLTVQKRYGQLASPPPKILKNGQASKAKKKSEAWRDHVKADGRVHGRVNQNAAVTGRMTHSNPNMAQVPSVQSDKEGNLLHGLEGGWGYECRELFYVPKGKKLVGADASGLELRCLAHFMARYDGGEYARILLEGDIHAANQKAAGLPTRNNAKTFIYAFLYGAGDNKIGSIVGKGRQAGAKLREKFLTGLPALAKLVKGVKKRANEQGYLRGLDGRKLHVRSDHAALNTLLQSAGALVMKKGLAILDETLQNVHGLVPGVNYEFVGNIHDEWQIEVDEEFAELVGKAAVAAITAAGDFFNFRCRLDGEYKIGSNWAETH